MLKSINLFITYIVDVYATDYCPKKLHSCSLCLDQYKNGSVINHLVIIGYSQVIHAFQFVITQLSNQGPFRIGQKVLIKNIGTQQCYLLTYISSKKYIYVVIGTQCIFSYLNHSIVLLNFLVYITYYVYLMFTYIENQITSQVNVVKVQILFLKAQ